MKKILIYSLLTINCSILTINSVAANPRGATVARAAAPTATRGAPPAAPAAPAAPPQAPAAAPAGATVVGGPGAGVAARAARTTNIIATGANAQVRQRIAMPNMNQECYEAYYGCMDLFCMSGNEHGGSCMCSAEYSRFETQMNSIQDNLDRANYLRTVGVERVQAGAMADILFTGTREYDRDGNVVAIENQRAQRRARHQLALSDWFAEPNVETFSVVEDLTGRALYDMARGMCSESAAPLCNGNELNLIMQTYTVQIRNDCQGLSRNINDLVRQSEEAVRNAERDVRDAQREQFEYANRFDRGTCMVEFTRCMQGSDACGQDWARCVDIVGRDAMMNQNSTQVGVDHFAISPSVMEMLSSRRHICESVLDQCIAVRNMVWPDFLRNVAPELRIAESRAESRMRQSCLTDVSDCIQNACRANIGGMGETMDACLARPEMVRSFCRVELDPCERMEPLIWNYVTSRLAALRVDACTEEVRRCYTDEGRCGADFSRCIGMDFEFLHRMCPIDSLVVCRQGRPNFRMEDISDMLMGFFMNVDNAALEVCQARIDNKMMEVCGSLTDCNRFAADTNLGTGSLRAQQDGDIYRITGMLSFGMINMGDGYVCDLPLGEECTPQNRLPVGRIGVQNYISRARAANQGVPHRDAILESIESELRNIEGTINRTINLIESDPEIQFCISGRDLSQILGPQTDARGRRVETMTEARFPNLLNNQKMLIAASALRQAHDNYNERFNHEVAEATRNASADLAQFMCHNMATGTAANLSSTPEQTSLTPPFAISWEVGLGLTRDQLMTGGAGSTRTNVQMAAAGWGSAGRGSTSGGGANRDMTAVFNRETRICRFCTTTTITNCRTTGSQSWFHNNRNTQCTTGDPIENCQEIPM